MTENVNVLFDRHDIELQANSIADFLPPGIMFAGGKVTGTNLRSLLRGLGTELFRSEDLLKQYTEEYLPDCTVSFLDEWESALGIPDDCFTGEGTNDTRRRDILAKLASLGVQTADDFEDLALIFGVEVEVQSGVEVGNIFTLVFPVQFLFDTEKQARFTIVVTFLGEDPLTFPLIFPATFSPGLANENEFPLEFPFVFGSGIIGLIKCLFTKLKPANCDIVFVEF